MSSRFAAINDKTSETTTLPNDRATESPNHRTSGRPPGKRRHPDFEKVGLYLHAGRRKQAERKWEDEGKGDFSDLIDILLTQYLSGQSSR